MYKIAQPNEYFTVIGVAVDEIKVCKKAIVWPGQTLGTFSMAPTTYRFEIEAM